jgi:hypothetical protein
METVLDRHLGRLAPDARRRVEAAARASIDVNVALASASGGSWASLGASLGQVLALGPSGIVRFLRDTRLSERVLPRVRARLSGAF